MKDYKIELTKAAIRDIKNIFDYINDIFNMPIAAQKNNASIINAFELLSYFPFMGTSSSTTIYKIVVGSYIIYYKVNIRKNIIYIKRIRHKLQNNNNLLNKHEYKNQIKNDK